MVYTPREIKDRVAVGDDIFIVEDLGNNRIRLIPAPTHVSEPGTPINKALLQPIEDALGVITQKLSGIEEEGKLIPRGLIAMWSGSVANIPSGWALCDGRNGTPDLRDRFIVGAGGAYNPGNTGGAESVTLTVAQMPQHSHGASSSSAGSHTHSISTSSEGSHTHDASPYVSSSSYRNFIAANAASLAQFTPDISGSKEGRTFLDNSVAGVLQINMASAGSHSHSGTAASAGSHSHSITVGNTGSSQPHENRPPYYALCFIMKL